MRSRRGLVFGLVAGGSLLVAVGTIAWAVAQGSETSSGVPRRGQPGRVDLRAQTPAEVDPQAPLPTGREAPRRAPRVRLDAFAKPLIVFQHVVRDGDYAHVAVKPATPKAGRMITELVCERVHFGGGRGLCLLPKDGLGVRYRALVISSDFAVQHEVVLGGLLSRARVSPDGRYGASTSFVSGHSYAVQGAFSTNTTIFDLSAGKAIANLEDFEVQRDGEQFDAIDHNFWGVTFARDSNRLYATLSTRGKAYLVEGDVAARRLRVLHENVECPSLSPDQQRIAYKKRVGRGTWRLHVLDLATGRETPLAETRSIDDQVEWLDDRRILYGTSAGDVWAVPADGTGSPAKYLAGALSPAVVRG